MSRATPLSGTTALRVLFIGGTGVISAAAAERALAVGHRLTILNRGSETLRPAPDGAEVLKADIRNTESVRAALRSRVFDVVVEFIAFTADHVSADIELFTGRTGQYVFISSASAYQKPPSRLPILESTPLRNPFWQYSRDKIACEELLITAYREDGFPVTIIRPSHTYDRTKIALTGGWTDIARMRAGQPVVVHGDGTSLWTLTHSSDFAKALVGLLGLPQAIGDSFTITSDEYLPWNMIGQLDVSSTVEREDGNSVDRRQAPQQLRTVDPTSGPRQTGHRSPRSCSMPRVTSKSPAEPVAVQADRAEASLRCPDRDGCGEH
jgi:nucleoside-diphosphate-sugar epimerase